MRSDYLSSIWILKHAWQYTKTHTHTFPHIYYYRYIQAMLITTAVNYVYSSNDKQTETRLIYNEKKVIQWKCVGKFTIFMKYQQAMKAHTGGMVSTQKKNTSSFCDGSKKGRYTAHKHRRHRHVMCVCRFIYNIMNIIPMCGYGHVVVFEGFKYKCRTNSSDFNFLNNEFFEIKYTRQLHCAT